MSIEIKVPILPESIADATVAKWHKKVGETIERDENLVDLETDKVVLEVPSTVSGIIEKILVESGQKVKTNVILATVEEKSVIKTPEAQFNLPPSKKEDLSPSVRRTVAENELNPDKIQGTGKGGRLTQEDVKRSLSVPETNDRLEKRVVMSPLRKRIAERLLMAKQSTAMLTTFNEVNLEKISELRIKYKERFEKKHGVRLGYMSFFVSAAVHALKRFPDVNASIDGEEIVYHNYFDIGMAVSTPRGLVVPILRNADQLDLAAIEKQVSIYAEKARDAKLTLEEMAGGTFTITNGGIFGSLLSTPILNPPQSAILGMHAIQSRPIVIDDKIVIRPMMYLALSYDHRIIDGQQSVLFLKTIKEFLEYPEQTLLDL